MSKEKTYTPAALEKAINAYFNSISRTVTAQEKVPTGEKDKWGHEIYELQDVINDKGKVITYTEYVIPPSVIDLCLWLKISRQTLLNYEDDERYLDTITRARGRIEGCKARMLHTSKNVQGVMFDLECNHKWKREQKMELDVKDNAVNVNIQVVE